MIFLLRRMLYGDANMDEVISGLVVWLTNNFNWNSVLLAILIIVIIVWLYKGPEIYSSRVHDQRTSDSALKLQMDLYYRKSTGEDIKDNLEWWTSFLTNPDEMAKQLEENDEDQKEALNKRLKFIMQYGSARTVRLLSLFMAKSYTNKLDSKGVLVCVAYVVASLRADYTGQNAAPMDLLQVKINDYQENEHAMKSICRTIKRETGIDDHLNYHRLK